MVTIATEVLRQGRGYELAQHPPARPEGTQRIDAMIVLDGME